MSLQKQMYVNLQNLNNKEDLKEKNFEQNYDMETVTGREIK